MKSLFCLAALACFLAGPLAQAAPYDPPATPLPSYYDPGTLATDGINFFNSDTPENGPPNSTIPAAPSGDTNLVLVFQALDAAQNIAEYVYNSFVVPIAASYQIDLSVLASQTAPNDTYTLNHVGFILSPTQIPLDNLNFGNDPPDPGSAGSPFTPLPQYDGSMINDNAGESVVVSTPVPKASLGLAACLGILVLMKRGQRKESLSA